MHSFKLLILILISFFLWACTKDAVAPRGAADTDAAPQPAVAQPEEVIVTANRERRDAPQAKPAVRQFVLASAETPANIRHAQERLDRENYTTFEDNPVHLASEDPVSTFSIDVDTASYSNLRRLLNQGALPRHDAIRVEELVNYFSYAYPTPNDRQQPFTIYTELGPSPWHADRHLLHIGIKGFEVPAQELPASNLVFLIDVSGSMQSPDKLELLKTSMKLLTKQLDQEDSISIAVYAGAAGVVLEPTSGDQTAKITSAIDKLTAGGSTNGGAGIRLAYALAEQAFMDQGVNRVILATDGDFNVGTVNQEALKDLIEQKRKSGVALTVLGFGTGNYNDALMQELAQIGNGNAAYIDTINEARKVLVDEMSATLLTIAKDVKIQVEFNPEIVREYRLIGYETRRLDREDFNNDRVDAGDIGAGHTVTAIYEIALQGSAGALIDPLRYDTVQKPKASATTEIAFLRLRYKAPNGAVSRLVEQPIERGDLQADLQNTSETYRFSAAVAAFGQLLRGGEYIADLDYAGIVSLAQGARGSDPFGYRGEFLSLVRTADALSAHVDVQGG